MSAARRTGWWPYVVMGVILIVCLAIAAGRSAGPETAEDRINAVAETIKCPTCQGESVADSNAPSSRQIRDDIADRLSRGESPDQIRAFYAQSYGDAILLTPSATGLASVVWVVPVVALVGIDGIQPSRADCASRSAVWLSANRPSPVGEASAPASYWS